ncbi:MAG: NAD(P)/FAD-dependent oxidoreductase [Chromatiales bacterium]|nr:NAD(P)/FAD-dependent oxidoreductase [Gammaproteobacteria bacterium]MBW6475795.1 NAD(P)/FAD-dependent oxidoreductase [Chromatiales bacterium]
MKHHQVIVIGAGAAGLMCAAVAGQRGREVLVLDQSAKPGNKIRMSGGGRCNFTNYDVGPQHYLCHNPHFVKSALSRFSQWDFLALVERYRIPWHEREHGQLFCNDSARDILEMLLSECGTGKVAFQYKTRIETVSRSEGGFVLHTDQDTLGCEALVVASGGLSIPSMGSSPFGYRIAEQFGIKVWPPSAGLVPLTLQPQDKQRLAPLAGIAVRAQVETGGQTFVENVLFTHRGLSGPAILQASNYWQPGQVLTVDWLPQLALTEALAEARRSHPKQQLKTWLSQQLPTRLLAALLTPALLETPLAQLGKAQLVALAGQLQHWQIIPNGTEGYRTAEVTRGGVDCDAISSKTMQATTVPGLYFIGEVLDVTGWLGGYNFQWAWASGWCAGQYV